MVEYQDDAPLVQVVWSGWEAESGSVPGYNVEEWVSCRDVDFSKKLTREGFVRLVKYDVRNIGLDPALYAGHSFRAGGATDLFDLCELSIPMIMKLGR